MPAVGKCPGCVWPPQWALKVVCTHVCANSCWMVRYAQSLSMKLWKMYLGLRNSASCSATLDSITKVTFSMCWNKGPSQGRSGEGVTSVPGLALPNTYLVGAALAANDHVSLGREEGREGVQGCEGLSHRASKDEKEVRDKRQQTLPGATQHAQNQELPEYCPLYTQSYLRVFLK